MVSRAFFPSHCLSIIGEIVGKPLGWGTLIINPLYYGYLLGTSSGISSFQGLLGEGWTARGRPSPKTHPFPYDSTWMYLTIQAGYRRGSIFNPHMLMIFDDLLLGGWSHLASGGKWLVTPIYKSFRPIGRGTTYLGDLSTMVINHLQVLGWSSKYSFWCLPETPVFPKGAMVFPGFHFFAMPGWLAVVWWWLGRLLQKYARQIRSFPQFSPRISGT